MCGFLGANRVIENKSVDAVINKLKSRGPDQNGTYSDNAFTLISCRLSIVDSAAPCGPYFNEDKSLAIVFNGEIYNYAEIKNNLKKQGHSFRTDTDAEVLLHAYEEYGEKCLEILNGQFSFAVYHLLKNKVFLARDRFGIKPFYFYNKNGDFIFSSSTLAINTLKLFKKVLNEEALRKYLVFRYNDLEETFFKDIHKLPPASYAVWENGNFSVKQYYSKQKEIKKTDISLNDAAVHLKDLLSAAVLKRIPEDMSTGMFLSGGVDSAAVFSLLSSHTKDINPYGFSVGTEFDEIKEAKEIADNFGHKLIEVKGVGQSYLMLDKITDNLSEPVGDAILIPMAYLAGEAALKQKVIFTGEGADEVFSGYIHQQLFYKLSKFPYLVKMMPHTASLLKIVPLKILNMFFNYPEKLKAKDRDKIIKMLKKTNNFFALRQELVSLADINPQKTSSLQDAPDIADYFNYERFDLQQGWLSDYSLTKFDAVSMAFSVEGRVPFLDHNLVDFVNSLPPSFLSSLRNNKIILRNAFFKDLGALVAKRPKKAFYFPYADIFDSDFEAFASDYIEKACKDPLLKEYIDFRDLQNLRDNIKSLSLFESKKFMNILIFIIWYFKNF